MPPSGPETTPDAHEVSESDTAHESWRERYLVSNEYSWLWFAQVISAFGDWIGLLAITALATNISGAPDAATALVLTAGSTSFFIGPFMGALIDRYDRKILMRIADIARAVVFLSLPFVNSLWGLIVASFLLEVFTLLWSPAKEALVPGLVPHERLTTANSLGVLAAYGTFPLAGGIAFLLKIGNDQLAKVAWLGPLQFDRPLGKTQALAFYFDALTFIVTALIVWRCIKSSTAAPRRVEESDTSPDAVNGEDTGGFRQTIDDIRDGWRFIFENPIIRAVNLGLAAALLGGAMLVPLGPTFAKLIIGDSDAFSLYITALGLGVALGVAALTAWQKHIPKDKAFVGALFLGGCSLLFGVSMSTFWLSAIGIFLLGVGAGAVYILGYTLLQENTADEMRGRTFTTFLTLVRLCVLGAMVLGPVLSASLGPIMKRLVHTRAAHGVPGVHLFGVSYGLPGVRITLWLAGGVVIGASVLAARSLKVGMRAGLRGIGAGWRRDQPTTPDEGADVGGGAES